MTSPNPIEALSERDRATLRERIKVRIRRAKNEGGALFILSAVTAVIAALSAREYHTAHQLYIKAIPQAFDSLFIKEHERRDEMNFPGIVAAVFSVTPTILPPEICDRRYSQECKDGKELLDTFGSLFRIWVTPRPPQTNNPAGGECGSQLSEVATDQLLAVVSSGSVALDKIEVCRWVRDAARDLELVPLSEAENANHELHVKPCTQVYSKDEPIGVGASGCINDTHANLFTLVPSETSEAERSDRAAAPIYPQRVLNALKLRSLLRLSLERRAFSRTTSSFAADSRTTQVRLVQAYFISPDSVLHIWAPGSPDGMGSFPRSRLWATAWYFQYFATTGDSQPYYTKPYVDFGGHGIVRTECRPLNRPAAEQIGAKVGETGAERPGSIEYHELVGIVCADFAISVLSDAQVIERLTQHPFLHSAIVRIRLPSDEVEVKDMGATASRPIPPDLLRGAIKDLLNSHPSDLMRAPHFIKLGSAEQEQGFLIPVEEEADGVVSFLAAFPRDPKDLDNSLLKLARAAFFSALWIFFVATNGFAAYRERQTMTRIALFRSLQAGVMETRGEDQVIIRANDRAEELVRRKLPKELTNLESSSDMSSADARDLSGVHVSDSTSGESTYRFRDLVKVAVRLRGEDHWFLAADQDDSTVEGREYDEVSAKEIAEFRAAGVTTRYWILLATAEENPNEPKTWLQVVAGPYVPMTRWKRRGEHVGPELMTYGVVEPASPFRRRELTDWYKKWLRAKISGAAAAS